LSLFAAAAGAVFSTRQILLHILPGDAGYGTALFGYHYYTLALIGFVAGHRLSGGDPLVRPSVRAGQRGPANCTGRVREYGGVLVVGLTALNVSILPECGFGACADNPVVYELLKNY